MPTPQQLQQLNPAERKFYEHVVGKYPHLHQNIYLTLMKQKGVEPVTGAPPPAEPPPEAAPPAQPPTQEPYIPLRTQNIQRAQVQKQRAIEARAAQEGWDPRKTAQAIAEIQEVMTAPRAATGFTSKQQFADPTHVWAPQPLETAEGAALRKAKPTQSAQINRGVLYAEALRDVAKQRGTTLQEISREVGQQGEVKKQVDELAEKKLDAFLSEQQQSFARAVSLMVRQQEDQTPQEIQQATAQGTRYVYMEWLKKNYPEKYKEFQALVGGDPQLSWDEKSFFSKAAEAALTEEKEGVLYETQAQAALRTLGGLTRVVAEPVVSALTYEVDERGERVYDEDFGFVPAKRTAAAGAKRAITGDTLSERIVSGMKSGRMLTDDLLQIESVTNLVGENVAFGVGLVMEMLLPITPLPVAGGLVGGLGKAIKSDGVVQLGAWVAHPLGESAARLNVARKASTAGQFGIDTGNLTAKEVLATEVVEEMLKGIGKIEGSPAERIAHLQKHLATTAEEATSVEVKRALEAMSSRAAEEFRKNEQILSDAFAGDVLQKIMVEEVASTLLRAVPNDVFMPTPGILVSAKMEKELGPVVNATMKKDWGKEPLMRGDLGPLFKDSPEALWAEARKGEYFFETPKKPKPVAKGETPEEVPPPNGVLDRAMRGEKISGVEADNLRLYIKEQLYLNPSLMGKEMRGAAKALGREAPTALARKRAETPVERRLSTLRAAQDVVIGISAPMMRAARKHLPRAVKRAEEIFLSGLKTEGVSSRLSAELSRIEGVMLSLPKQFKEQLKAEYRGGKNVVDAYEAVLRTNVTNKRAFYTDFLETFFSKDANTYLLRGSPIADILDNTMPSLVKNFAETPASIAELEMLVAEARKIPGLERKGLQRGLVFKEDALLEASAIAALKSMAKSVRLAELKNLQRRYPDLFTKILKGSPPDVSATKRGLQSFFQSIGFKSKVAEDTKMLTPEVGFGAIDLTTGKGTEKLNKKMLWVEKVGLNVDTVIEDIVDGILKFTIQRYDAKGKQSVLEDALQSVIEKGTVSSDDIFNFLFGRAFYRSDEVTANYRDVWRRVQVSVGKKYDSVVQAYKNASANLDPAGRKGAVGFEDGELKTQLKWSDVAELHRRWRVKMPPGSSERLKAMQESIGTRTGLFEYKEMLTKLRERAEAGEFTKEQFEQAANLSFDYVEKQLAARELFRELFRTVTQNIGGNIASDLAAQIIGVLNKSGYRTGVGRVSNIKNLAEVVQIQENIFTFGTPELARVIRGLQEKAIDGSLSRGLDWIQRRNKDWGPWLSSTIFGLLDISKRSAMSGMLGGFGPIPVTRFHFLNFFTFPFIQSVTNPGMVWKTLERFPGAIARTMADEFDAPAFRGAMSRWASGDADDIIVKTPSGGVYTHQEIRRIIDETGLTRSGLSFEFTTADLADIRRVAGLNSTLSKSSHLRVLSEMFNPANKALWSRMAFAMDGAYREAALLAALQQGRSVDDAVNIARNTLLDYGGVSQRELAYASRYMYFYTFWRMNMTETLAAFLRSPEGALKNIRRIAVFSREQKKYWGTLNIEPPSGLDRLWSYRGEDYDNTPSIYAGLSIPALNAFMQLGPAFNFALGALQLDAMALQQETRDFSNWVFQAPGKQFLYMLASSLNRGDFFRDDSPASFVPSRLVVKLKAMGMWDFFVEKAWISPVSDPKRMIPGKETVGGQQWRFTTKSGYQLYLALNLAATYAGINRAMEETIFSLDMAGAITLEDVNLKRYKDGKWYLYPFALETPLQGSNELQQLIKNAEAQSYILKQISKPD